jgi:arginine/lysine/ornithine decarboxylase
LTDFLTLTSEEKKSVKQAPAKPLLAQAQSPTAPLSTAVTRHCDFELASFHTPGHKGRPVCEGFSQLQDRLLRRDLTELPGLDDLTAPRGVIAQIEDRAARLWGSQAALLSVAGASAGLMATMVALAASDSRRKVLLPRNVHRSVVHGLILSGLMPVWYEPIWDCQWQLWGHVSVQSVENLLKRDDINECCALLLVSPTYAGAMSDVQSMADRCRRTGIALVVDEAHGAHLLAGMFSPSSAAAYADVTVQSLHKTLSGLTQTGLVHVGAGGRVHLDDVRAAMALVSSSSPSYPLMQSIDETVSLMESVRGGNLLKELKRLEEQLIERVLSLGCFQVYRSHFASDAAHVLIRSSAVSAEMLYQYLQQHRVFPETVYGSGVLLMLGIGSTDADVDVLTEVLKRFRHDVETGSLPAAEAVPTTVPERFSEIEQVLTPRQAFFMPSEMVPIREAIGRIAHECVAPCPPGVPICIPGQRVHQEVMDIESLRDLSVVKL